MRIIAASLACVAVLLVGGAVAQAGGTSLIIKDSQTITHLEDNDWEFLLNADGSLSDKDSIVDVGDYLVGMYTIQFLDDAHPGTAAGYPKILDSTTGSISAVFMIEVVGKDTATPTIVGGADFAFAPAGSAAWTAIGLPTPTSDDTMVMMYDDGSPFPFIDAKTGAFATDIATAVDGTLFWEFGFAGGGLDPTEFWGAQVSTDDISSVAGGLGSFAGSLNVTDYAAGFKLLPHDFVFSGGNVGPGDAGEIFSQFQFTGGFETLDSGISSFWDAQTDTDVYVRATPEPGSLALLGLGLAACGGWVIRRRRRTV
jgi:hypothetical protein